MASWDCLTFVQGGMLQGVRGVAVPVHSAGRPLTPWRPFLYTLETTPHPGGRPSLQPEDHPCTPCRVLPYTLKTIPVHSAGCSLTPCRPFLYTLEAILRTIWMPLLRCTLRPSSYVGYIHSNQYIFNVLWNRIFNVLSNRKFAAFLVLNII